MFAVAHDPDTLEDLDTKYVLLKPSVFYGKKPEDLPRRRHEDESF